MQQTIHTLLRSKILRRILYGFAMVATVLGVGLISTIFEFEALNGHFTDLLEHDVVLVDDTEQLQRLVSDLQSNKRGYLLTGDPDFLARYTRGLVSIREVAQRVVRDTSGRPEERLMLERFRAALDRYIELSTEEIAIRQSADRGERPVGDLPSLIAARPGAQVILSGERALDDLRSAELRLVDEQRERVVEGTARSRRQAVITMLAGLLVAVVYGIRVSRDIGAALASIKAAIEATARREPTAGPLDRDDEIGDVSRSFYEMDHRLARIASELSERVGEQERTLADLREANEALASAMRVKSDFLATMSHELRTPLNAVIGLSDLLLGSRAENLSARAREALETMRASGSHLLALLDDILELAKIDAGKMTYHIEDFTPAPLVRACVATALPLLGDKPVEVTCEIVDASTVRADPHRVRQILLNLLSNAVKFTDRGSVRVRVERDADTLVVRIADTGMGIAHPDQSQLFEDFHQVRSGDARPYGGTGLGLALSRRMARAMGGDVTVESEPLRGSTFTLHLPLSTEKNDNA
ncbi:MAG: ATP-binding protein [Polyangiales bacterium]